MCVHSNRCWIRGPVFSTSLRGATFIFQANVRGLPNESEAAGYSKNILAKLNLQDCRALCDSTNLNPDSTIQQYHHPGAGCFLTSPIWINLGRKMQGKKAHM